ncbi:MAG: FISUMP domain-containing protein [Bacteroidales bacterium]
MKNKSFLMIIAILVFRLSSVAQVTGIFIDSRDSIIYKTIILGTQTWMAENLAFTANSGCWQYDTDQSKITYGCLYNWETAKNVCPSGWHLPSNNEFTTLTDFLGGDSIAGGKMKEEGMTHWESPNTGANNKNGFTALPGGYCDNIGEKIMNVGKNGILWSSTEYNQNSACNLILGSGYQRAVRGKATKTYGFSLRCIKN